MHRARRLERLKKQIAELEGATAQEQVATRVAFWSEVPEGDHAIAQVLGAMRASGLDGNTPDSNEIAAAAITAHVVYGRLWERHQELLLRWLKRRGKRRG